MNELILIKEFLLFNINIAFKCIDSESNTEVSYIELKIIYIIL
jgi:hypothetical protein